MTELTVPRSLLAQYIQWVRSWEGVDYILSGTYYHEEDYFTPEEWELLRLIASERDDAEPLR